MKRNPMKRGICLILALVMVLSMMPVQAYAAGTEHHEHTMEEETAYHLLQQQAEGLLLEARDASSGESREKILAMVGQFEELSQEELLRFARENPEFVELSDAVMAQEEALEPMATSGTVLNGQITVTDTASNVSVSGGTVTVTVKGSGGLASGSTATNTVTITNTSGGTAAVSFRYDCSATGTFTFSEESNSGSWSGMMAAGETITMIMTATGGALWSSSTATLKLTEFSLTPAQDSSRVTVDFDGAMGSVTADGSAVTPGTTLEGITPDAGVALVATPAKGYAFACWLNTADGTIAAYEPAYTLQPMEDVSVQAVFFPAGGDACFRIGNTLYDSLNEALAAAVSGDVIILVSSGTLAAGAYTIPAGITLLIPNDESGSVYTTAPASAATATTPSAYRTLTLKKGASLTVNGTLSVAAKHYRSSGRPVGKYGYMLLEEGSDLKINGKLYAYGYIGGKGTVKVMSGASVYEYFQIIDFRGGTATLAMYGNSREVFPLSQYYVQNVEAPMTLEAGATEYGYTTLYMSSTEYHSTVKFIGTSGAMFNLTSGSVTKAYDGATDRLRIRADGTMTLEPMSLSVSTMSINSRDYVLPINSSITIELEGGSATIKQDLALQPNAELIVGAGATCTLGSGVRLYVYDQDQWGSYVYSGAQLRVVPYAPGRTYKSATSSSRTISGDAAIRVAGTLDASAGKLYTTESGAAITGVEGGIVKMASVSSGSTYQATQSGTSVSYDTIAVTSAKLQNAGGGYVSTSANTYTYEGGAWGIYCAHSYTAVTTDPTCTQEGSTTYTCGKCGRSYSETIPATGHRAGEAVTETVAEATCTQDGSADTVVSCAVCGAELSRERNTIAATGHRWDEGNVTTAPGCETAGVKTYVCTVCGESRTEVLAALGHDMVYTPSKDATCTEDGEAAGAYCSRCDYVEEAGGVIPALGHKWKETARVEADCTNEGSISHTCERCGETKTETIAALGHAYTGTVTAPTCIAEGFTTYTCDRCGSRYLDDIVPAMGHSHQAVLTEPTCTEEGYTTYTCAVCGDSYVGDMVPAAGHDYGDGSVTVIAACTTAGVRTYTCAVCGDSYDAEIPALGHELKHHGAKLPSYTSVGWDAYEECARCDHSTYREYPVLKREAVSDYETFLEDLLILEQIADRYVEENPGGDPAALVLNYIRTGIPSYTTTSWAIMAGNENTDFTAYVLAYEDAYNAALADPQELISVVSIRELKQFPAPSDPSFALEFTHMFGTMDITGHNPGSRDHADVAGWAGDLVDLLDLVDNKADVTKCQTVEEMVSAIFAGDYIAGSIESFGRQDMYGDLDAYYIMRELLGQEYRTGLLTEILRGYFVEGLTDESRAAYFLENRMGGITNRAELRRAVYSAYAGNRVNTTLEGTRVFVSGAEKLYDLRVAVCYAFADYLWRLAGDYVHEGGESGTVSGETVTLAPGIIRLSAASVTADGEELRYYVTTADLEREDVRIDSAAGAGTVLALAQGYEANVIAGINAAGLAGGSYGDSAGFAAILGGTELVRDGRSVAADAAVHESRTAAGITKTGKAVFVTVESATLAQTARIMLDAGCMTAFVLDSGANTSHVSRMETEKTFTDHTENPAQVGAALLMISTAADNTVFDHAVLSAGYSYLTAHAEVQITATGVTARGGAAELPEGALVWSVSDETVGRISGDGVFTAERIGDVEIFLSMNGARIGSMELHVVAPDTIYFTTGNINAYFGSAAQLPLSALYRRKPVAIAPEDIRFQVSANEEGVIGGSVSGFDFQGNEESGLKTVTVTAALAANADIRDTITVTMYHPGDVVFDFDQATGGDRSLAWLRRVSNATTGDGNTYHVVDPAQDMVTDYTFAIDMSAIAVPEQLKELTNMLPGADQTDGTAWGFLLQLADRISVLSEVSAAIQVDPNFDVDLTGLSLQNEYFTLTGAELDPQTNLLHVKLNWVKQSAAIEPATANPICVVSGIRLTLRDGADWGEGSALTSVNSATLSYTFYLSAGALYTFAGDPANQAAYGLTPYINPNNSGDRGASFGADYASFRDSYTLVNALKNGWYFEDGQNVFYVDGVLHTQHTPKDSVTTAPGCTEGGYTTHVCAVCGIRYVTDEVAALGHSEEVVPGVDATCTETGLTEGKKCAVCGEILAEQEIIPALGHSAGEVEKENEVVPTCTGEGAYDIVVRCDTCGTELSRERKVVPALGHDEEVIPGVDATCTETGLTEGKKCTVCGEVTVEQKVVPALGHDEEVIPGVDATCTETGLTEGKKCAVCGEVTVAQKVIPALGHDEEVIPGVDATCTETGLTEGKKCAVCGEVTVEQKVIPALGHAWKGTGCTRCAEKRVNPFVDVSEGEFYIDSVLWALEEGITSGTSANTFSPNKNVTRAEAVTFLWRSVGSPEPGVVRNPFVDVREGAYYYKAVLWAYENGITAGVDGSHFAPNTECSRAQIVTFLWRTVGKPVPGSQAAFTDVVPGVYYYDAVAWAYENGITSGMGGGIFGVNIVCTRAQVVTFLYRLMA